MEGASYWDRCASSKARMHGQQSKNVCNRSRMAEVSHVCSIRAMYCIVPHCFALHCTALHCTALHRKSAHHRVQSGSPVSAAPSPHLRFADTWYAACSVVTWQAQGGWDEGASQRMSRAGSYLHRSADADKDSMGQRLPMHIYLGIVLFLLSHHALRIMKVLQKYNSGPCWPAIQLDALLTETNANWPSGV